MRKRTRFGKVLERLIRAKGIPSFREFARRSGLQPASVSFYVTGRQKPRIKATVAMARALEIPQCIIAWFAFIDKPKVRTPESVKKAERIIWDFIERWEKTMEKE